MVIPDSVTTIGDYAFIGCNNVKTVYFPESLQKISYYSFYECTSITDVYYAGSANDWKYVTIENGNDPIKNATFHPNWSPSATLSFNANGGTGAPSSQTSTTIPSKEPTRAGYTFRGWAKSSSASSPEYRPGDKISFSSNTTLYAVWKKSFYGDLNHDGVVNTADSTILSEITVGLKSADSLITLKGDLNGDGKLTQTDVLILAQYCEKLTDEFPVEDMFGLVSITMQKTDYKTGESIKVDTFNVTYTNYVQHKVKTGFTYTPVKASGTGQQIVTATLGEWSAIMAIQVSDNSSKVLSSISVASKPTKTTYKIGESLNTSGLKIKLTYNDGSTETITSGFTTSGFSSTSAGTKTVTVSYGGKTTTFSVTVAQGNVTKYTMSSASGKAGDSVVVYVAIANNPGVISVRNTISYDTSALQLVKVEDTKLLNGYTTPAATISSPYTLRWADSLATKDNMANGNIVKLTFTIKNTAAEGSYSISVNPTEARNVNGSKVAIEAAQATITVVKYIPGDIDNDGEVSDWDAIVLNRYLAGWNVTVSKAADVDKDGDISDWDAIVLERYLAGWNVTIK